MAQFIIRNIEESVKVRLQKRARKHGRSMEEEIREILRNAVNEEPPTYYGLGTKISSLFVKEGLDLDVVELRGHTIQAPEIKE